MLSPINTHVVSDLLSPELLPAIAGWLRTHPREFFGRGWTFYCGQANGEYFSYPEPTSESARTFDGEKSDDPSVVSFLLMKGMQLDQGGGDVAIDYSAVFRSVTMPARWFVSPERPRYHLYNITFGSSASAFMDLDESFRPFSKGYVGVTSRRPNQRFSEHIRDMESGKGYTLHSCWRSLRNLVPQLTPAFSLLGRAATLDEIYDLEERYVEKYTLAPAGLNAIPGGKAGLRLMHLLQKNRRLPTLEEREAALVDLEEGRSKAATHYRRGHIRKLPARCESSATWVSPCWVNAGLAAA